MLNLIDLCQRLIRFQSTTPQDDGIMNFLVQTLDSLGFSCHLLPHVDDQGSVVHNLYARRGTDSPNYVLRVTLMSFQVAPKALGHTHRLQGIYRMEPFGGVVRLI